MGTVLEKSAPLANAALQEEFVRMPYAVIMLSCSHHQLHCALGHDATLRNVVPVVPHVMQALVETLTSFVRQTAFQTCAQTHNAHLMSAAHQRVSVRETYAT